MEPLRELTSSAQRRSVPRRCLELAHTFKILPLLAKRELRLAYQEKKKSRCVQDQASMSMMLPLGLCRTLGQLESELPSVLTSGVQRRRELKRCQELVSTFKTPLLFPRKVFKLVSLVRRGSR